LKLSSDDETLAENKVIILYILNQLSKPISNDNLYKLVLSSTNMNYFYFQQFLLDLADNRYIDCMKKGNEHIYMINAEGKNVLKLTEDIVPGITKLQVDTSLDKELDKVENSSKIIADYTPISENHYIVSCKIIENNDCIFEIKTYAPSREEAKKIVDNWDKNYQTYYSQIINMLTQENKDEQKELKETTEKKKIKSEKNKKGKKVNKIKKTQKSKRSKSKK